MRFVVTLAAPCLVVLVFGRAVPADEPKADAMSAREILDRMAKTYAGCKTYRDSGVVTTLFIQATRRWTVEKPFKTAFARPDRFRFEFSQKRGAREVDRYIVWRKGDTFQTWWDLRPGVARQESLGLALAGATGVSGGSAHTVPVLLLPREVGGRMLTDLTEARRAEDAKLDKVDCFRVEGMYADAPMTLWIDQRTFLLRRIDTQKSFDEFRIEETTTLDPVIDEVIPEKALEFDRPSGD